MLLALLTSLLLMFPFYTSRKPCGLLHKLELTIWGPTFTLIGPKVLGKIFVGELVLETGNVIIEMLPKESSKKSSRLLP